MYRVDEVSVHRACCERATQSYSLGRWCGGGYDFSFQAQDQQVTTRSPRIVSERLRTRLMLIKMYVYDIYSRFRAGAILSIRKYKYDFITTVTIELNDSVQS